MLQREFGDSGLTVSALGLGAGQIGGEGLDDSVVGALQMRLSIAGSH